MGAENILHLGLWAPQLSPVTGRGNATDSEQRAGRARSHVQVRGRKKVAWADLHLKGNIRSN